MIGIVAPSSKVPDIEFDLGVDRIREAGFEVQVHPQCRKGHWFFAGTDQERAQALYEYASDSRVQVIWCARGGYGAARILPLLDRMTSEKGVPGHKLLVGYSDTTALMDFVRKRWGWSVLHAPMPGLRKFCLLTRPEWKTLFQWIGGEKVEKPWGSKRLKFYGEAPSYEISGELVGGNLTVWASLQGTPYESSARGKILFLEDVDEAVYRIDRIVNQLIAAGKFDGVRALVLGNFLNCRDTVSQVLTKRPTARNRQGMIKSPKPSELGPLRKKLNEPKLIAEIFGQVTEKCRVPVAYYLPVGHGPEKFSLPIGAQYRLSTNGNFEVLSWDWTGGK